MSLGSGMTRRKLIPPWIKSNAGWWANGDINDETFVQGIQFLIEEGILKVPQSPE